MFLLGITVFVLLVCLLLSLVIFLRRGPLDSLKALDSYFKARGQQDIPITFVNSTMISGPNKIHNKWDGSMEVVVLMDPKLNKSFVIRVRHHRRTIVAVRRGDDDSDLSD